LGCKDGTQVPISMVYKRSDKDGKTHYCFMPMVHMVIPWMPIFHQQDYPYSTEVLFMPLHIRGGEDLGRQWYEGGKLLKKNTFKDFIACSTYLIDQNILLQHICMLKVDLLVDY
jgi:oligopeptidase B